MTFRVLEDGLTIQQRMWRRRVLVGARLAGPPQHVHRQHDESFFVLSGNVRFTSGTKVLEASAGGLRLRPSAHPHTFANADPDAPASLLCIVTPERYIGYFRDLTSLRPGPDGALRPEESLEVMNATRPSHTEHERASPLARMKGRTPQARVGDPGPSHVRRLSTTPSG
ncbi:MAG: cupin domain-containing protein [Chloroflexota bacterium]